MTDPLSTPQNRRDREDPTGRPAAVPPETTGPAAPVTDPTLRAGDDTPPRTGPAPAAPGSTTRNRRDDNSSGGKKDQAKDEARGVADDAQDAGRAVKDTAVAEAGSVKDDAAREGRKLLDETSSTLSSQASDQMNRAASTVRSFTDDIGRMARGEQPEQGLATDLADRLNSRSDSVASWLESHEPNDLVHEVQRFARRRPVAFLGLAAGIGFAAGRLTRGLAANRSDDSSSQQSSGRSGRSAASSTQSAAPVAGDPITGTPAYGTAEGVTTPGYSDITDPYATGGTR